MSWRHQDLVAWGTLILALMLLALSIWKPV